METSVTRPSSQQTFRIAFVFVVVGSLLRALWPGDMEYKGDERWLFEMAQRAVRDGIWPAVGMPSSQGTVNPGLSAWIFAVFAFFVPASPTALVLPVQWLNVAALWGWLWFIARQIPAKARDVWFWGLTLFCVSSLPIVFSRKIWQQDVLPIFTLFFFLGHWFRARRSGSFGWGFFGSLLGQIHMSGFFFVPWVAVFTGIYEYKNSSPRQARWVFWVLGSAVGALGLIPWLLAEHGKNSLRFGIHGVRFFTEFFRDAWGLSVDVILGPEFWESFVRLPVFNGRPTYAIGALHVFALTLGLSATLRHLGSRSNWRNWDSTEVIFASSVLAYALTLNLLGIHFYPHYLILIYPGVHFWAARCVASRPRWLWTQVLCQLLISVSYLAFIHFSNNLSRTPYGIPYNQRELSKSGE